MVVFTLTNLKILDSDDEVVIMDCKLKNLCII